MWKSWGECPISAELRPREIDVVIQLPETMCGLHGRVSHLQIKWQTVSTDNGFLKCSRAKGVISFIESCQFLLQCCMTEWRSQAFSVGSHPWPWSAAIPLDSLILLLWILWAGWWNPQILCSRLLRNFFSSSLSSLTVRFVLPTVFHTVVNLSLQLPCKGAFTHNHDTPPCYQLTTCGMFQFGLFRYSTTFPVFCYPSLDFLNM